MALFSLDNGSSLTDDYKFYTVVIYVLFSISLLTALQNALVIISVVYFTPKSYPFSPFICSVSTADILRLLGPVSLSFHVYITKKTDFDKDQTLCKIQSWLIIFLRMASTLSILMLSVDRFISLIAQNFYGKKWKGISLTIVVISCWVVAAFTSSWPLFSVDYTKPVSFSPQIYCLFSRKSLYGLVFASVLLFCVLLSCVCCFQATNSSRQSLFRASYSSSTGKMAVEKTRHLVHEQYNQKVSKMVAIVVGIYSFCLVPWLICLFLDYFSVSYPQIYGLISIQFPMVSGLCNPLIYGVIWPPFRRAYEKTLTAPLRMCRKRSEIPGTSDIQASRTSGRYSFWTSVDRMNADHQVSTIDRLFGSSSKSHEPIDLMPHELRMFENEGLNTDSISINFTSSSFNNSSPHLVDDLPQSSTNVALENGAQFQSILDLIEEMTEGKTKATISRSKSSIEKCRRKNSKIFRKVGSNVSSIDRSAVKFKAHTPNSVTFVDSNGCDTLDLNAKLESPTEEKDFFNSSMNSSASNCACIGKSKCYKLNKETRYLDYLDYMEVKEIDGASDPVIISDV